MRVLLLMASLCALPLLAGDADAIAISARIQARHLPFGTIVDPMYASPSSNQITGYTRCGDSALWTGHYLAAESFRYNITGDPAALANVRSAMAGIQSLVNVTGTDLLARCLVPITSPYAAGIESEESANGVYTNTAAGDVWIGNTSRDQYSGVMFGLAVAYDFVNDSGVRSSASQLITRIMNFLQNHAWTVVMPDGTVSTTFVLRPDEIIAFLQIAEHVNPAQFSASFTMQVPTLTAAMDLPIGVDVLSNSSYFKFNLDYINLYNLIRLDNTGNGTFKEAYSILRDDTAGHQNAFFNMIDRALNGADDARDGQTAALLNQWLERPPRDPYVNLQGAVPACGSEACQPVPVPLRPTTDFLWQRDPFQLAGGGGGTIESAGIDYILPYWMARGYGVLPRNTVQSAAAVTLAVAPDSIAVMNADGIQGGSHLTVIDAQGVSRSAMVLYASSTSITFVVPPGTAPGLATFRFDSSPPAMATATVSTVAPALFSMSAGGTGVAAATAVAASRQLPVFACTGAVCVATPISLSTAPVSLTLYGTGIRHTANVLVSMNGISVPVISAGAQPQVPGLDQITVSLPAALAGAGLSSVITTAGGQTANAVQISVK